MNRWQSATSKHADSNQNVPGSHSRNRVERESDRKSTTKLELTPRHLDTSLNKLYDVK